MNKDEIDAYIERMIEHRTRQLLALENAVRLRYGEKPVWDPIQQGYFFVIAGGRMNRFNQRNQNQNTT